MRRTVLGFSSLVLAAFLPASSGAGGLSLRWDNCYSDGGAINKTFACDTNSGSERLVMSFTLDNDMPQVSGTEVRLFIVPSSATLPSWWQFRNVGSCRMTALTLQLAPPPGSVNCADWANGNGVGGIAAYTSSTLPAPNGVQLALAVAVPPSDVSSLAAGQDYLAGSLVISNAKTVGAGACGGCDEPVCLVLDRVNITTPVISDDVRLSFPAVAPDSEFARWQNGQETDAQIAGCGSVATGCRHQFSCQLSATPTRGSTWGAVKGLYK